MHVFKFGLLFSFLVSAFSAVAELPADYQSWSAEKKQEFLWDKRLEPSKWKTLPELSGLGWGGIVMSLKSLGSLALSFDFISDELPASRTKLLHPYGSVAKVEFVAEQGSPYTGLFQGAIGIARLSLAGAQSAMGYTPGMALKFFVDGLPSRNLHVMQKLSGQQEDQNFFANTFSNILPKPDSFVLQIAAEYFGLFVENPIHLSVDHLAYEDAHGLVPPKVFAPYQIFFQPTSEVQIDSQTKKDFREELAQIPIGATLYNVFASRTKVAPPKFIGKLVVRSQFVASAYGDHVLLSIMRILDARLYYSGAEAEAFFASLSVVQRQAYLRQEYLDLLLITAYTVLFFFWFRYRLPSLRKYQFVSLVPGIFDLIETLSIIFILRGNSIGFAINFLGVATFLKWTTGALLVAFVLIARRKFTSESE